MTEEEYLIYLGYSPDGYYGLDKPQSVSSVAYEKIRQVKIGHGLLYGFTVYNSAASAQFVQVFDLGAAPAAGAIPVVVYTMATVANFAVEWTTPRTFLQGCWVANSSTGPTYTAGSADCFFDVQFL